MTTSPRLLPAAACRSSHVALLSQDASSRNVPENQPLLDAIVVPASRSTDHLLPAIELGIQLDALVVVFCSKSLTARDVAEFATAFPELRWAAIDIPADYHHALFDFATSRFDAANIEQLMDLSVKRNLGLALAKLSGWNSLLFLDDDITHVDPKEVLQAIARLGKLDIVGLEVAEFPDNSVVCHANRLAGGRQDTFISGSTVLINCQQIQSFFPAIYNEDWLYFFDSVCQRRAGRFGNVLQQSYEPFARLERAVTEEFGEVIAEGLMELAHGKLPLVTAEDAQFWRRFLHQRQRFIEQIATLIAEQPSFDLQFSALEALRVAEDRRSTITPELCVAYIRTWSKDRERWSERVRKLPRVKSLSAALSYLNLNARSTLSPALKLTSAKIIAAAENIECHPSARIFSSAQIGVPYRQLLEGEWDRLNRKVSIGANCEIGHFCSIGEEAVIGNDTVLDSYCMVESGATIGKQVLMTHRATVGIKAVIGDHCIIGTPLVCERSQVGNNCRIFGDLVHRQADPAIPWDAPGAEEISPVLGDNVFVGRGAQVVGDITIGDGTYICAGATVTKDVGAHLIVTGINQVMSPDEWTGALGRSEFFPH